MAAWHCRVCGLDYDYSPWGLNEDEPDYDFCECCGVEFGHRDYTISSTKEYREEWLAAGGKWFYPKLKPADWSLDAQLTQIPANYR